ncbi:thioredoxin family protein [Paenibacillus sp. CMAA1364]
MKKITSKEQFDASILSPNLTVAIFKADWCVDCKYIEPFIDEVEEKFSEQLMLVQVDIEQVDTVSEEQNIMGIPSFVAYANGQELVRFVNKQRKSREEIEKFLQTAIDVYEAK